MNLRMAMVGAAAMAVAVGALPPEARAETVQVTASGLNVRSGPSTRYKVRTVIRRGQRFEVTGRRGGWRKLRVGSIQGWAAARYLKTVGSRSSSGGTVYTVTASALNVRTGPSTRYRKLGTVRRGQKVRVSASRGSWRKIRYGGRDAWVHGAYLTRGAVSSPAPSSGSRARSRAGFIQLRASGSGYYAYSSAHKRWGTPRLIYALERVGARRARERSPRIGVGNISRENGGYLFPHVSHRKGKDADIRPVRHDGRGSPTTIYSRSYSRTHTQRLVNQLRAEVNERVILFNDRRVSGVRSYPGHHNHLHLSVR